MRTTTVVCDEEPWRLYGLRFRVKKLWVPLSVVVDERDFLTHAKLATVPAKKRFSTFDRSRSRLFMAFVLNNYPRFRGETKLLAAHLRAKKSLCSSRRLARCNHHYATMMRCDQRGLPPDEHFSFNILRGLSSPSWGRFVESKTFSSNRENIEV